MERASNLYRRPPQTPALYPQRQVFRLIDIEGRVLEAGGYQQFVDDPIGWDKIAVHFRRGKEHGVNYEFSDGEFSLEFDQATGRSLIMEIMDKAGPDALIGFQYGYFTNESGGAQTGFNYYLRRYVRQQEQEPYHKLFIDFSSAEYEYLLSTADYQNQTLTVTIERNGANDGVYTYYQLTHEAGRQQLAIWLTTTDLADVTALNGAEIRLTAPNENKVLISSGSQVEYIFTLPILRYYQGPSNFERVFFQVSEQDLQTIVGHYPTYWNEFQIIDSVNNSGTYAAPGISGYSANSFDGEGYFTFDPPLANRGETSGNVYVRYLAPSQEGATPAVVDTDAVEQVFIPAYFDGKLNLFDSDTADDVIKCPLERTYLEDRYRTRFDTEVNFSDTTNLDGDALDTPPQYSMLLPAKPEFKQSSYYQDNSEVLIDWVKNREESVFYIVPEFNTEDLSDTEAQNVTTVFNPPLLITFTDVETSFMRADVEGVYTFDIELEAHIQTRKNGILAKYDTLFWDGIFQVRRYDDDGNLINTRGINIGTQDYGFAKEVDRYANFKNTISVFLLQNEEVFIYHQYVLQNKSSDEFDFRYRQEAGYTNRVTIRAIQAVRATSAKSFLVYDALQHLLRATTDPGATFKSDFFGLKLHGYSSDGMGGRNVLMIGEEIRQLPSAAFRADFQTLYDSLNAQFCIGQGFEYDQNGQLVFRIEATEYFYQNAEILRFETVTDYREQVAKDWEGLPIIVNEIEVGYKKYLEEELNTLDSVHTRQKFLTPIRSYKKKLDLVSELICDPYALEYTRRRRYNSNQNESSRYDDDIFLLAVQLGLRENYYAIEVNAQVITVNAEGVDVYNRLALAPGLEIDILDQAGQATRRAVVDLKYSSNEPRLQVEYGGALIDPDTIFQVVFISALGGLAIERDEPFKEISNINDPATFANLRHTPTRMERRWAQWVNSGLYHKDGSELLRSTYRKNNRRAVTQLLGSDYESRAILNAQRISEGNSFNLRENDRFKSFFEPIKITFKAPVTWPQIMYLRAAHQGQAGQANNGYLSCVDYDNNLQSGYLLDLIYNPVEEEGEFTLLKKSGRAVCLLSVAIEEDDRLFTYSPQGHNGASVEYQVEQAGTIINAWTTEAYINKASLAEGTYQLRARLADSPDCETITEFTYVPAVALLHVREFSQYDNTEWYDQTYTVGLARIKNEGDADGQYTIDITLNGTTARILQGPFGPDEDLNEERAYSGPQTFDLAVGEEKYFAIEIDNQTGSAQDIVIQIFDEDGRDILNDGNRQALTQITVRALVLVCGLELSVAGEANGKRVTHSYDDQSSLDTEYQVRLLRSGNEDGGVWIDEQGNRYDWEVRDHVFLPYQNEGYSVRVLARTQASPECFAEITTGLSWRLIHNVYEYDNLQGGVYTDGETNLFYVEASRVYQGDDAPSLPYIQLEVDNLNGMSWQIFHRSSTRQYTYDAARYGYQSRTPTTQDRLISVWGDQLPGRIKAFAKFYNTTGQSQTVTMHIHAAYPGYAIYLPGVDSRLLYRRTVTFTIPAT